MTYEELNTALCEKMFAVQQKYRDWLLRHCLIFRIHPASLMKTDAHILDEDRKVNAQKFESAFYSNPDLRGVRPPEEPKAEPAQAPIDLVGLVEQLQKSPELAATLAALIAAQPANK